MIVGLLLALGAALTTGVASVLQGLAARRAAEEPADSLTDGSIRRLLVSPLYLSGVALDGLGFACMVVALHWLPLFLVQCAAASSVGVTALVGRRVLGTVLGRASLVALCGLGLWPRTARVRGQSAGGDGRRTVGAMVVGHRFRAGDRGRRHRVALGRRQRSAPVAQAASWPPSPVSVSRAPASHRGSSRMPIRCEPS